MIGCFFKSTPRSGLVSSLCVPNPAVLSLPPFPIRTAARIWPPRLGTLQSRYASVSHSSPDSRGVRFAVAVLQKARLFWTPRASMLSCESMMTGKQGVTTSAAMLSTATAKNSVSVRSWNSRSHPAIRTPLHLCASTSIFLIITGWTPGILP